jgi:hypothetical protein
MSGPVWSNKYGRWFKDRSALGKYSFRDRYTKPILSWGGLRDSMNCDQWNKDHQLGKYQPQVIPGIPNLLTYFVTGAVFMALVTFCAIH